MDNVNRLIVRTDNLEHGVASLYCLYEGHDQPQGAHVQINPVLVADVSEEISSEFVAIVFCDYADMLDQADSYSYLNNTSKYIDCPSDVLNKALLEYLHSSEFESKALKLCEDFKLTMDFDVNYAPKIIGEWNDQINQIISDIKGDLEALERADIHLGSDWIEQEVSYPEEHFAVYNYHGKDIEINETNIDTLVDIVESEALFAGIIEIINVRQAFEDILENINLFS